MRILRYIRTWFLLYWRVVLGAIGALLFALAAYERWKNWQTQFIVAGFVVTLVSVVFQTSFAQTNGDLAKKLQHMTNDDRELQSRRVFVLLAAHREQFQSELNYQLLRVGRESGLLLQVFCPSSDFSSSDFQNALSSVLQTERQFSGGLLVASQFADNNFDALKQFAEAVRFPIVFIDHVPPEARSSVTLLPTSPNVGWVTTKDSIGGEKAAQAVIELCRDPARILILAGPAKEDRHLSFREAIQAKWPQCEFIVTKDGVFDRQKSETAAHRLLVKSLDDREPYDLVFCTSDSMTLGCLDAIASIDWGGKQVPTVVGYDGIEATRKLIDSDRTALKRVVVQDTVEIAETAVHLLRQLTEGINSSKIIWVEPRLYPDAL